MDKNTRNTLIKYLVAFFIELAIGLGIYFTVLNLDRGKQVALCDAFSVPGIFYLLVAALLFVAGEGAFDGIGYLVGIAFRALIPGGRLKKQETYAEYKERKRPSSSRSSGTAYLWILGGGATLVGVILTFAFGFI